MSGMIFINYRRADTGWTAHLVRKCLADEFSSGRLFIDVELGGGVDFVAALEEQLDACDAMVALIGSRWLTERDETGGRRLDNPDDWVRMELEAALLRDVRVIPVLIDGAAVPSEDELPELLKPLARRQAMRLTSDHFAAESQKMVGEVRKALANAEERGIVLE